MRHELRERLASFLRGGAPPKTGVTGVTGVAGVPATCPKSLKLQQLRQLRIETDKLANDVIRGVAGDVTSPPEPDEAEIEERKGIAMASVPEPYRDAFARLKCQRPIGVGEAARLRAIDDAGRFVDQWASLAVEFGWKPGDLFDVPREGKSGLVWHLAGETVRSIGPDGAFTTSGRVFDRLTRDEWINPYSK
jgi:hypothetical protein